MAINAANGVDVALSEFGGLNTEFSPPDIPQGLSPSCSDVRYMPGEVRSREGLSKFFGTPVSGQPRVLYVKTYLQRDNTPLTLFLTSDGKLWKEEVAVSPGTYTQIGTVTAGSYAQSITVNGREYIAFHDGEYGLDVPLQFDGTNLDRVSQDGPGAPPTIVNFSPATASVQNSGAGAAVAISTITPSDSQTVETITKYGGELSRTVYTTLTYACSAAHGLSVGSTVVITGCTPSSFNRTSVTVTAVVNATTFKIAFNSSSSTTGTGGTVTVSAPSIVLASNVATATTLAAHNFSPGWQVQISGIANAGVATIAAAAGSALRANGKSTLTTTVAHGLPVGMKIILSGVTDTSFNVTATITSVPTPTTFTIDQPGAADASSANGTVSQIWSDTFVISDTPTTTTFTYGMIGPDGLTTTTGTATIVGRITAGPKLVSVSFLTRQGYITAPSPPVAFTANGNQLALVSDLPIGPPNISARIVEFTGSEGATCFYIPVQPISSGVVQGTSTVIPDNTSTSAILDFSDTTLFASQGVGIPGNDLFNLVVLGPVLGFGTYQDRILAWGERNKIQNLVNMGLDGGYISTAPTLPLGWANETAGGALVSAADYGFGWQITGDGTANPLGRITQTVYQDIYNVPIVEPNFEYIFRCWLEPSVFGSSGSVIADIYSATDGLLSTATISISNVSAFGFYQADFNTAMPASIPSDALLRIYASGQVSMETVTIDECEVIFAAKPYLNNIFRASYVLNPESFDDVTGILGPASDSTPVRACSSLRNTLLIKTGMGIYATTGNPLGEPSTWPEPEVSLSVGAVSLKSSDGGMFSTGEAGIDWDLTATRAGLYLYMGGSFSKISQEIQDVWDSINWQFQKRIWVKNDNIKRRIYVGLPIGESQVVNAVYMMDYRQLDNGSAMAEASSLRRWAPWSLTIPSAEMLVRQNNEIEFSLGGIYGNIYSLDPDKWTDDDYGQMVPYYTTYFFPPEDSDIGKHRKLAAYLSAFVEGTGQVSVTPLVETLTNAWTATPNYSMSENPTFDLEWGLNVLGEKIAFKFQFIPESGETDVHFSLQRMSVTMRPDAWAPVRGRV